MTQSQRILRHLEDYGSITQMDAIRDVNDLRREGHPIITEVVDGRNRYGEKTRWARYRMGVRG